MSNRPRGFGLTAELNKKKAAKFDVDLSNDCLMWMNAVFEDGGCEEETQQTSVSITKQEDISDLLKDGVLLCKLVNVIKQDSVKKINNSNLAFKKMENINHFIAACESLGCKKQDLFQSVDLYESQNIPQVINGIMALGRKAQESYDGPALGPPESTENIREFSEEQLNAGKGIIGLQAGSNQGASQAGQNFGKTRSIID